jgi:hypothetical protein
MAGSSILMDHYDETRKKGDKKPKGDAAPAEEEGGDGADILGQAMDALSGDSPGEEGSAGISLELEVEGGEKKDGEKTEPPEDGGDAGTEGSDPVKSFASVLGLDDEVAKTAYDTAMKMPDLVDMDADAMAKAIKDDYKLTMELFRNLAIQKDEAMYAAEEAAAYAEEEGPPAEEDLGAGGAGMPMMG